MAGRSRAAPLFEEAGRVMLEAIFGYSPGGFASVAER